MATLQVATGAVQVRNCEADVTRLALGLHDRKCLEKAGCHLRVWHAMDAFGVQARVAIEVLTLTDVSTE